MITHTELTLAAQKLAEDYVVSKDVKPEYDSIVRSGVTLGFIMGYIFANEPKKRERKESKRSTPNHNVDFDAHR